jgi:hypothetical protein
MVGFHRNFLARSKFILIKTPSLHPSLNPIFLNYFHLKKEWRLTDLLRVNSQCYLRTMLLLLILIIP